MNKRVSWFITQDAGPSRHPQAFPAFLALGFIPPTQLPTAPSSPPSVFSAVPLTLVASWNVGRELSVLSHLRAQAVSTGGEDTDQGQWGEATRGSLHLCR